MEWKTTRQEKIFEGEKIILKSDVEENYKGFNFHVGPYRCEEVTWFQQQPRTNRIGTELNGTKYVWNKPNSAKTHMGNSTNKAKIDVIAR